MTIESETVRDAEAMRDAALAAGMETWDADRIAIEVRKVRNGEGS